MIFKFTDTEGYVIDGEMLDCYLDCGLKLEFITIKMKLQYEKSEWLRPYIEFNVWKRKEAKSRGDRFCYVFCKLMNNGFYGKTIDDV